jgi:hypothetical protein
VTSGEQRNAVLARVYVGSVRATAAIRVSPETRERAKRIAAARSMSVCELVDELATQPEDLPLLKAGAKHYDQLKSDPGPGGSTVPRSLRGTRPPATVWPSLGERTRGTQKRCYPSSSA